MDTYVVSDLHITQEDAPCLFADGTRLLLLLARLAAGRVPARLIFNGDTFDFLAGEGAPRLDPVQAAQTMRQIAGGAVGSALLRQVGVLLARGSEVTLRLGNHDLELALPAVQTVIRDALRQPSSVAARLQIVTGDAPLFLSIGGVRVLVTHGEHDDPFNQIDYPTLLQAAHTSATATQGGARADFRYPAGSLLMRTIVAPLRRQHGLRFLDFLKPDFHGAVLTALALVPEACGALFQSASWDIAWQLLRTARAGVSFAPGAGDEPDLGLADRIQGSGLSAEEAEELLACVARDDGGLAFSGTDAALGSGRGLSPQVRAKLLRAGLSLYARVHRAVAGQEGHAYFSLTPGGEEAAWAEGLANRHRAAVVLTGHTHAARFWEGAGHVYANSGTWIWLMRLPTPDASIEVWTDFLQELRDNADLNPTRQQLARLECVPTVLCVQPVLRGDAGLRVTLAECQADGLLIPRRSARVPRGSAGPAGREGDTDV